MTTKSDIVKAVAADPALAGVPRETVETAVNGALNTIAGALRSGGKVELRGFGTFAVKDTKARTGRNPRTGEAVQIPAGRKVSFKASKDLLG
ncbi:MAG: HU family DNA-binding protein [Beijerinckiaceae bacterium]